MAFSMSSINVNRNRKNADTRPLFSYINSIDNISMKTKRALTTYLRYRLSIWNADGLDVNKLTEMITDLLENCCGKCIEDITAVDTDNNYEDILYQLKYAIDKKFRFVIYHEDKIQVDKLKFKELKLNTNQKMTQAELDSFFEGVIFI